MERIRPVRRLSYLFLFYGIISALQLIKAQNHTVNVGALLASNSIIGQVAKQAIELAVAHINRDSSVLNGTTVVLHTLDSNCSAIQGAAAAMGLLKSDVVAVAGPQSTAVSHFVAQMGGSTQVPFVSFAATDPALSEFQYPYFFRIAHTDAVQMTAIAALIAAHSWREVVVLCSDDDFGSNGATALGDALELVGVRLVRKAALPPNINRGDIGRILTQLAATQSRVFVVHTPLALGLMLFSEAKYLGMMTAGYAWMVTDSITATLGSTDYDADTLRTLEGVVGTRGYHLDSPQARTFVSEWKNGQRGKDSSAQPPIYGFYAYDSMWMIAYALDSYLRDGLEFTFKGPLILPSAGGGSSGLAKLRVFDGGPVLRRHMLQTKFNGTSGFISVNSKGDLVSSAFEIVNMVGQDWRVVGYWANETQLSLSPPSGIVAGSSESLASNDHTDPSFHIVWPGVTAVTPRGWVLPQNGRPLRIAVPHKTGFTKFVGWFAGSDNKTVFYGFCIDVFESALKYLPYGVSYTFVPYGNGSTPVYNDMVYQLQEKVFDVVVGDITVTAERMQRVDFTQPYLESGIAILVPLKDAQTSNEWAFLRPFTPAMWLTTLVFFIFTGIVIWMLEHKLNRDFRGRPKKQVVTVLWFTFSTLFSSQSEETKSTLGRFVLIIWLFVVLIIISSYTANLTSILTVQELVPTIQGISSLQASDVPIGYQTGSYVRDYLISLKIAKERLRPLPSMVSYARALHLGPDNGGVAAIVDELAYIQVFLGTHCGFTTAGPEFTKAGWGFAFPKDSEMAVDISTAILAMAENRELQKIHDVWLSTDQCGSTVTEVEFNQLDINSFWGLFLVTGLASTVSLLVYLVRLACHFSRKGNREDSNMHNQASGGSLSRRTAEVVRSFAEFFDEATPDAKINTEKKKLKQYSQQLDKSAANGGIQAPDTILP